MSGDVLGERQAIYFDITTSLSWGGAQVGITRVEREIARRAVQCSRYEVRFCIYNAASGLYYILTSSFADAVLNKGWWIELGVARSLPVSQKRDPKTSGMPLEFSGSPAQAVMALHREAERMSLRELLDLRRDNPVVPVHTGDAVGLFGLGQIIDGPVPLNGNTWIVNGGLDWEHKNIRHLRGLKRKTGFHYATIIYDVIPLLFPQYVVPFYVDLLKRYFGELFWTADIGICISRATRFDVQSHLDRWRMPALPLVDWPLGSDIPVSGDEPTALPAKLRDKPFLLYVSTIEPRKSHRTIVEAFDRAVRDELVPDTAMCVFVGRVGWNSENLLEEIHHNPRIKDRVLVLSGISDAELISLYEAARFVVFPSRYEGYGLSLVEGMAMGKACFSGDAGSLREVGGDAPRYIDPIDIPGWTTALAEAFGDDDLIRSLEARSRSQYSPVSWDQSARRFFDLLDAHVGAAR